MASLVVVRHGETAWNEEERWSGGRVDIRLSQHGRREAAAMGAALRTVNLDMAHTSTHRRSIETLDYILAGRAGSDVTRHSSKALNERDFGRLTGELKSDLRKRFSAVEFNRIRRSWATPTPGGESLQQIHARVGAYFRRVIIPELIAGCDIVVVGHTNSLRALVVELENVPPTRAASVEWPAREILTYNYDGQAFRLAERIAIVVTE